MKFQYFRDDVRATRAAGNVSLDELVRWIKTPGAKMEKLYSRIRSCTDAAEKARLKKHLYFILAAAQTDGRGRGYKNVVGFTGAAQLDFDKIPNPKDFKEFLFREHDFIIASWLSPSGKGVKALASIPIVESVAEYQSYFWGLSEEGEMFQYMGFDEAPQNAVLPLFIGGDPDILYRKEYDTWRVRVSIIPPRKREVYKYNLNPQYKGRAIDIIQRLIRAIEGNGHPQVRSAAFTLGGYVGADFMTCNDAEELIEGLINENDYLSKGISGYVRTAKEMIKKGMEVPLYF